MQADLIIYNGDITLRPGVTPELSPYVKIFELTNRDKIVLIKKCKKTRGEQKEDDPNLLFAVLYKGKVAGAIVTQCQNCDAAVVVDIQNERSIIKDVKKMFVQLCKDTQIYDNIKFGKQVSNTTIDVRGAKKIACYQSKTTSV